MADHFYVSPDDPPAKQEMLKAALKLFVRDGVRETNIRAIAAESGYTNPALFKHFRGKDALALHLFERCYLELAGRLDAALAPKGAFAEKLRALLGVFATFIEENPEAFLFIHDQLRDYWPKVSRRVKRESLLQKIRAILQQGVKEGSVRSDVRLDLLVAALVGFLMQFARMSYFGEFKGPAQDWTGELEQVCRALVQQ
jgi:AcrR family transcriptional regulator